MKFILFDVLYTSIKWKKMPITKSDLININNIQNKMDEIEISDLDVRYFKQDSFKDILLKKDEYFGSEKCSYIVGLKDGLYFYDENRVIIYDAKKKMVYEEVHNCM